MTRPEIEPQPPRAIGEPFTTRLYRESIDFLIQSREQGNVKHFSRVDEGKIPLFYKSKSTTNMVGRFR